MSGLTVKECYRKFPSMDYKEMCKLMGTRNFTDDDVIPAKAVASYNGRFARQLSVFYAKNDTQAFVPLLQGEKQRSIMDIAGINSKNVSGLNTPAQQSNGAGSMAMWQSIPMGTSVFTLDAQYKKQHSFV